MTEVTLRTTKVLVSTIDAVRTFSSFRLHYYP